MLVSKKRTSRKSVVVCLSYQGALSAVLERSTRLSARLVVFDARGDGQVSDSDGGGGGDGGLGPCIS